ncbi:MAG: hypothetical protein JXB50_07730 [Spirochaetes bacterium]|nr:hypothetical protein [Spirochaetota bacterium]
MFLFKKKKQNQETDNNTNVDDPLEPIWQKIRKDFPIKNYILKEDLPEQLVPQVELIKAAIKSEIDFSKAFYSYITFQQIYFHLKNYMLFLKKRNYGYGPEFFDIFQDIFLDNFLIFKELTTNYLSREHSYYLNIWLDGFFLSLFRKVLDADKNSKYNRIQPQLFFVVILFLALPEISDSFNDVPFTSLIKFQDLTQKNWGAAVELLKNLEYKKINSPESYENIRNFIFKFFMLNVFVDQNNKYFFDEISNMKCAEMIEFLIEETPELIKNIKKIRSNLLNDKLTEQESF